MGQAKVKNKPAPPPEPPDIIDAEEPPDVLEATPQDEGIAGQYKRAGKFWLDLIAREGPTAIGAAAGGVLGTMLAPGVGTAGGAAIGAGTVGALHRKYRELTGQEPPPESTVESLMNTIRDMAFGAAQEAAPIAKGLFPGAAASKRLGTSLAPPPPTVRAQQMGELVAGEVAPGPPTPSAALGSELRQTVVSKGTEAAQTEKAAVAGEVAGRKARAESKLAPPMPQVKAGEVAKSLKESKAQDLLDEADSAYDEFRKTVNDPKNTATIVTGTKTTQGKILDASGKAIQRTEPITESVQSPVPIGPIQATLRPMYTAITKEMPLSQRDASPGYTALKQFMERPAFVAAEVAERDLGALKTIARETFAALRSRSKGIASTVLSPLQKAIDNAIPEEARIFLQRGRDLTRLRHETYGTRGAKAVASLAESSPISNLVRSGDKGITRLDKLVAQTGEGIKSIAARQTYDALIARATNPDGTFSPLKFRQGWQALGPEMMRKVFTPEQVKRISALGDDILYSTVSHPSERLLRFADRNEPVKLLETLTLAGDRSLNMLSEIATIAPESIPKVTRNFIEGTLRSGNYGAWGKLGDQTRAILSGTPEQAKAINDFYTYATTALQETAAAAAAKKSLKSAILTKIGGLVLHYSVPGGGGKYLTAFIRAGQLAEILTNSTGAQAVNTAVKSAANSARGNESVGRILSFPIRSISERK